MMGFILLLISAVCEALWNICLAKSKGIIDWRPNVIGALILAVGIWSFKRSLAHMPLSIAIVIWSGASLIFTITLDVYFFETKIDTRETIMMILCIASILGLNYVASNR